MQYSIIGAGHINSPATVSLLIDRHFRLDRPLIGCLRLQNPRQRRTSQMTLIKRCRLAVLLPGKLHASRQHSVPVADSVRTRHPIDVAPLVWHPNNVVLRAVCSMVQPIPSCISLALGASHDGSKTGFGDRVSIFRVPRGMGEQIEGTEPSAIYLWCHI